MVMSLLLDVMSRTGADGSVKLKMHQLLFQQKGESRMDKFVRALIVLFAIGCLCFVAYVLITYGDKPITDIPAWAIPFFWGR